MKKKINITQLVSFITLNLILITGYCQKSKPVAYAYLFNLSGEQSSEILLNDKLNSSVVWKGKKLNDQQFKTLLCAVKMRGNLEEENCFLPFHGIVIYDGDEQPLLALSLSIQCATFKITGIKKFSDKLSGLSGNCNFPADSTIAQLKSLIMDLGLPVFANAEAYARFETEIGYSLTRIKKPFYLPDKRIGALTIDKAEKHSVFIGCKEGQQGNGLIIKGNDNGSSWQTMNHGVPLAIDAKNVQALAVSPVNSEQIFAGTDNGMFKSNDGGYTWQKLNNFPASNIKCMSIGKLNSQLIFVGTLSEGLITSTDGGMNWHKMKDNVILDKCRDIFSIAVNENNNDIIIIGTNDGCYRSEDRGENWKKLYIPKESNVSSVSISPANPKEILISSLNKTDGHMYRTLDGGTHWKQMTITDAGLITSITQSTINPNHLVVGTKEKGVFFSNDGGDTWSPFTKPLPDQAITCVQFMDEKLLIGTEHNGLAVYTIETPTLNSAESFDQFNNKIVRIVGLLELLSPDKNHSFKRSIIRLQDGRYILLETEEQNDAISSYLNKKVAAVGRLHTVCHDEDTGSKIVVTAPCLKEINYIELIDSLR